MFLKGTVNNLIYSLRLYIGSNSSLQDRFVRRWVLCFTNSTYVIYLNDVKLNSLPQSQHNQDVRSCNEDHPNVRR